MYVTGEQDSGGWEVEMARAHPQCPWSSLPAAAPSWPSAAPFGGSTAGTEVHSMEHVEGQLASSGEPLPPEERVRSPGAQAPIPGKSEPEGGVRQYEWVHGSLSSRLSEGCAELMA